jgi:hypothetical protein
MNEAIYDEDDKLFGYLCLKVVEDINHINLLCDKIDLFNHVYKQFGLSAGTYYADGEFSRIWKIDHEGIAAVKLFGCKYIEGVDECIQSK